VGSAWAYSITALILLPVNFAYITHHLGLRKLAFLGCLWRPMLAAAIMYLVVRFLGPAYVPGAVTTGDAGIRMTIAVLLGAATYAGSVALLWLLAGMPPGAELWLAGRIRGLMARMRAFKAQRGEQA
jgi:hypothetical protein